MFEDNIDEDVLYIVHQLVEQIDEDNNINICDDCEIRDISVKRQNRSERSRKTTDSNVDLYLCENCSEKRRDDAEKVLKDLESLAHEVEQRLHAIENTERELDQWRDQQLQKNRHFWDEYRRQVENFSACRIRTLQYEYTIKQLKSQRIIQRLKRAKYLSENLDHFRNELNDILQPSVIDLLSSDKFKYQFSLFLSNNENNSTTTTTTTDDKNIFLEIFEQLSALDRIILPGDHLTNDEEDITLNLDE